MPSVHFSPVQEHSARVMAHDGVKAHLLGHMEQAHIYIHGKDQSLDVFTRNMDPRIQRHFGHVCQL